MNKFYLVRTRMLLMAACTFIAACSSDDSQPSPTEQQLQTLAGTWRVSPTDGASLDGKMLEEWNDFTLTIAKEKYTTSNSINKTVWPASGVWEFRNDDPHAILRDGHVVLDVHTTPGTLELSFTISSEAGRIRSVNGEYTFTLIKQ